jgi:hypothetical protein
MHVSDQIFLWKTVQHWLQVSMGVGRFSLFGTCNMYILVGKSKVYVYLLQKEKGNQISAI